MTQIFDIDNTYNAYQRLINFYHEHKDKHFENIHIEIHNWFAANMCATLGGILDLFSENINIVVFDYIKPDIEQILLKNDFLSYYGFPRIKDNNQTTIRFLKLKLTDGKYFNNYIINEFLNRTELPEISVPLKEKITEAIYEIFVNAQIHSESKHIYTCGQFFPRKDKIEFTLVDTGIGFKKNINKRFGYNLNSIQAIKWAIQERNTTKIGISGGIGLTILKEFIIKNKGEIQIISDDGFYQFNTSGEQNHLFNGYFPGTIVNMQFKTNDNNSYILNNELKNYNIF